MSFCAGQNIGEKLTEIFIHSFGNVYNIKHWSQNGTRSNYNNSNSKKFSTADEKKWSKRKTDDFFSKEIATKKVFEFLFVHKRFNRSFASHFIKGKQQTMNWINKITAFVILLQLKV